MHAAALEGVHARPFDLKARILAEHGAQAGEDSFRLFLLFRIRIPTQLEVDAPDIVGLAMQQGGLIAMERRVEPEPTLRGEIRRPVDIDRQKPVAEDLARAFPSPDGADR